MNPTRYFMFFCVGRSFDNIFLIYRWFDSLLEDSQVELETELVHGIQPPQLQQSEVDVGGEPTQ